MVKNWKDAKDSGAAKLHLVQLEGLDKKGRRIGSAYSIQLELLQYDPSTGKPTAPQRMDCSPESLKEQILVIRQELKDCEDMLKDVEALAKTYKPPVLDGLDPKTGETLESLGL